MCIQEHVDFVLIAGDFFNTAIPAIDAMHTAVIDLQRLKNNNIPVYLIAGSHDYAATGKTMLDVLEATGLFINVFRGVNVDGKIQLTFTVDPKTDAHITGVLGRAGMLDKAIYKNLRINASTTTSNQGPMRIFMFHTALQELRTQGFEQIHAHPLSLLPRGFDYYAGGHVHTVLVKDEPSHGKIVYPGPLFPADFNELEQLSHGGFFIWEDGHVHRKDIVLKKHLRFVVAVDNKSTSDIVKELQDILRHDVADAIITLRIHGSLNGSGGELHLSELVNTLYVKGAYAVLKNTSGISTPEFLELSSSSLKPDQLEQQLTADHVDSLRLQNKSPLQIQELAQALLATLSVDRAEGESKTDYEERILREARHLLEF